MSPGLSSVNGGTGGGGGGAGASGNSINSNNVHGGGSLTNGLQNAMNVSYTCSRVAPTSTGEVIVNGATCGTSGVYTNTSTTTTSVSAAAAADGKNCSLTVIQELDDEGHL